MKQMIPSTVFLKVKFSNFLTCLTEIEAPSKAVKPDRIGDTTVSNTQPLMNNNPMFNMYQFPPAQNINEPYRFDNMQQMPQSNIHRAPFPQAPIIPYVNAQPQYG